MRNKNKPLSSYLVEKVPLRECSKAEIIRGTSNPGKRQTAKEKAGRAFEGRIEFLA